MNRIKWKDICHQFVFWMLLILALGYLPSQVGFNLLCMAILVCPINFVRHWVDKLLEMTSARFPWYVIMIYFLGCYPLNQFEIMPDRITHIVRPIMELIN